MTQRTIRAIPPVPNELPWATARFLGAVKENIETLYGLRGDPAGLAELLGITTINNTTVVGGTTTWGNIGGVLSSQTDLQAALDAKATVAALALKADLAGATFTGAVSIQSTLGVTGAITHGAGNQVLDSAGSQSSLSGGLTLAGILNAIASGTGAASLNIPHGVAPTTPADGDFWSTTAGFFGQVNGTTVGPFAAGGPSVTRNSPFGIIGTANNSSNISIVEFRQLNDTTVQGLVGMDTNGNNVLALKASEANGSVRIGSTDVASTFGGDFIVANTQISSFRNTDWRFNSGIDLMLQEKAARTAAALAGWGRLWLRNDGNLMFTDDTDADHVLAGNGTISGGKLVRIYNQAIGLSPTVVDIGWDETLFKEILVVIENVQCSINAISMQCTVGESNGSVMHESTGDYQGTEHEWATTSFTAAARSDCIRIARNTSNVAGATVNGSIRIMGIGGQKGCTIWSCLNYVENGGTTIQAMDSRGFVDDSAPAGVIDTFRLFFGIPTNRQAWANVGTVRAYGLLG